MFLVQQIHLNNWLSPHYEAWVLFGCTYGVTLDACHIQLLNTSTELRLLPCRNSLKNAFVQLWLHPSTKLLWKLFNIIFYWLAGWLTLFSDKHNSIGYRLHFFILGHTFLPTAVATITVLPILPLFFFVPHSFLWRKQMICGKCAMASVLGLVTVEAFLTLFFVDNVSE